MMEKYVCVNSDGRLYQCGQIYYKRLFSQYGHEILISEVSKVEHYIRYSHFERDFVHYSEITDKQWFLFHMSGKFDFSAGK